MPNVGCLAARKVEICNWKEAQNGYIPFTEYKDDYFFQDQTFVYLSCSHGKLKNLFLQLADLELN